MTHARTRDYDAARVDQALRTGRLEQGRLPGDGGGYTRLADDAAGLSRGVVFLEGRTVPTYPAIGRIFTLERGVARNFQGPFWAEEKVDGYNVRVVRRGGRLLAFTRGGFLCPFTTDRLPDLADLDPLFDHDPTLVLCAEVAGPENPYINVPTPSVPEDVGLFAFDLMRLDEAGFLPLAERDALLDGFGIPRARVCGVYTPDAVEALRELVLELDAAGVEGVVLKPPGEGLRVKYVTPRVNLSDIVEDAGLLAELPGSFFTGRILRLVLGVEELGLEDRLPDMERQLGRALLEDFEQTLRELKTTGVVSRRFSVRVNEPEVVDRLLTHLNRHSRTVKVQEEHREPVGRHLRVTFRKTFLQSTSYLKSLLHGDPVVD